MSSGRCADYVAGYDRHGFAVFEDNYDPEGERCHSCYRSDSEAERHVTAWQCLLAEWDLTNIQIVTKLRKQVKNGVPPHLRGAIWKKFLDVEDLRMTSGFNYNHNLLLVREQMVDLGISEYCSDTDLLGHLEEVEDEDNNVKNGRIRVDVIRQILLDLERSFPTHRDYMAATPEGKEGRAALFRVLATFARYNPEVGYCQGMSFVAGLLLLYMSETDAFWCMVSLLERHKYLRGYFDKGMNRIQRHGVVFDRLLKRSFPAVSRHLAAMNVDSVLYVIPWFLALFTNIHCWESVLAIWDLFLLDGIKSLFQVGLALMSLLQEDLLKAKGMNTLLPLLLHPPRLKMHFSMLAPAIWQVAVEEWEIVRLEAEVHEEHRLQKSVSRKRSRAVRDEEEEEMEVDESPAKRLRSASRGPQRSMFQRLVNIFTPREQQLNLPHSPSPLPSSAKRRIKNSSASKRKRRSQAHTAIHISPCEEAAENRTVMNKNMIVDGTPVRRSPRLNLRRALQEINAPNVSRNTAVEFTFTNLGTPIILGQSQKAGEKPAQHAPLKQTSKFEHLEMKAIAGVQRGVITRARPGYVVAMHETALTNSARKRRGTRSQPGSTGTTPQSRPGIPRKVHTPLF